MDIMEYTEAEYYIDKDIKTVYVDSMIGQIKTNLSTDEYKAYKELLNSFKLDYLRKLYVDGLNFGMDRIYKIIMDYKEKRDNQ